MIRSPWARLVALVLVVLAAIVLVAGAYHVGVSAAIASTGAGASTVAARGWVGWGARGYGFPWFFFWPLFPILFILFIALLFRAAFWGRGAWRHDGWHEDRWTGDPAARLDEWHRRAHEAAGPQTAPQDGSGTGSEQH